MKNKIVAVKDKIFAKAKAVGTKIKTFAANVGTKVRTAVSSFSTAMKNSLASVRNAVKAKLSKALNKIPGMKFIKRWSTKILKQVGKMLLKKKAKQSIISKVFSKIAKIIGRALGKLLITGPAGVIALASLAWTVYDVITTYSALKDMLLPLVEELGYDTTRPAWFEKFLWDQAYDILFKGDPNGYLDLLYQAISDAIEGLMREIKFSLISAEKRKKLWH